MCVIIERKPNIILPFDKLETACQVNPDGYGIVFLDRGKMEVRRGYDPKGTDAEAIAKMLEEAKDINVIMHLRFNTVGKTDVKNTHPFSVLNNKDHGLDVMFMHNGTISGGEFRDAKNEFSDSYHFTQKVLTPLMERTLLSLSPEELLNDPLVEMVAKRYADSSNVFTLVDNFGNVKIINKSRGKEWDGWWSSNEYSFRSNHRTGSSTSYTYKNGHYTSSTSNVTSLVDSKKALPKTDTKGTTLANNTTANSLKEAITEAVKVGPAQVAKPEHRTTFCELTGMDDLEQATCFEQDDVYELVKIYPEAATILIMDLIYEMYRRNTQVTCH